VTQTPTLTPTSSSGLSCSLVVEGSYVEADCLLVVEGSYNSGDCLLVVEGSYNSGDCTLVVEGSYNSGDCILVVDGSTETTPAVSITPTPTNTPTPTGTPAVTLTPTTTATPTLTPSETPLNTFSFQYGISGSTGWTGYTSIGTFVGVNDAICTFLTPNTDYLLGGAVKYIDTSTPQIGTVIRDYNNKNAVASNVIYSYYNGVGAATGDDYYYVVTDSNGVIITNQQMNNC